MTIHPTHEFPDGAWFCTRCKTRKDDRFVALSCIGGEALFRDDPRATAETRPCDVEAPEHG